jgi:hypothetical protein
MRETLLVLLLLIANDFCLAQSRVSVQGGWTASKIRAVNPNAPSGVYYNSLVNFSFMHAPYLGFEYEYNHKQLQLSTGISYMALGAADTPFYGEIPWGTGYWVIPILGGYHLKLDKGWGMIFEGGGEIGIQNGRTGGLMSGGAYWGNINAVVGVELGYKRFRLGLRGHWGLTDFRYFLPITYKHTAITTYLSYDLWDHAKAKARRLQKQQEKQLN